MPSSRSLSSRNRAGSPSSKSAATDGPRVDGAHNAPIARFAVTTDELTDSAEIVVVDPYWFRVSWSLTATTLARAEKALGRSWPRSRAVLRILGLGAGESSAREVESQIDLDVPGDAREWFAQCPGSVLVEAQVGYLVDDDDARFFPLATSEPVATRSVTAPTIEPEAGLPDDVMAELQRMRTGGTAFSLTVAAELVLTGETAPGTEVGIGETTVTASASGEFEYRQPLENGRTVLPIEAKSDVGNESRSGVASADFNLRILDVSSDR